MNLINGGTVVGFVNHLNYANSEGKVFCKKEVKVQHVQDLKCNDCDLYNGSLQGEGVECYWNDTRTDHQFGIRKVINPYDEFESIKKLFFKKSSNHSKITGDFTEHLVLYWLSKSGYECARVDHTGIDLIARNDNEVLGISVKSRSRLPDQETQAPHFKRKHFDDIDKACDAFNCVPYIAFVVDMPSRLYVFLLSKETLERRYFKSGKTINWSMTPKMIQKYIKDPDIQVFKMDYTYY